MFGLRFCKIKQNIRKENSKLHRTEVSRNRAEVSRVQRWKFQEFAFKETFHHAQTNSGHNKLKPNVQGQWVQPVIDCENLLKAIVVQGLKEGKHLIHTP